jgi:hypothetical protein
MFGGGLMHVKLVKACTRQIEERLDVGVKNERTRTTPEAMDRTHQLHTWNINNATSIPVCVYGS